MFPVCPFNHGPAGDYYATTRLMLKQHLRSMHDCKLVNENNTFCTAPSGRYKTKAKWKIYYKRQCAGLTAVKSSVASLDGEHYSYYAPQI